MALHPDFLKSPFDIPDPAHRWFPADETLRESAYEKLLSPLVAKIRAEVSAWRAGGYPDCSETSRALLEWWFGRKHQLEAADGTQDDVRVVRLVGNLVLAKIHRVYLGDVTEPSLNDYDLCDYFLAPFGPKPVGKTTDSKVDLGEIVREIDELAVFYDEAHRTLPDAASLARLTEHKSAIFTERYADYLHLGVEEWRQSHAEHKKLDKKAVLFVMVDDTRNCDEVGEYLQKIAPELQDAVLVIHTKRNGKISEAASGKKKEELRKASNEIDGWASPYKAIVSVLMLKLREHLFEPGAVDLDDPVVLRNLAEADVGKVVFDTFKKAINDLTIRDQGAVRVAGDLSTYTPDFLVKGTSGRVWIIETKGHEEIGLPAKMARLRQWCQDATEASRAESGPEYGFVYVDQPSFERNHPDDLAGLMAGFTEFQDGKQ